MGAANELVTSISIVVDKQSHNICWLTCAQLSKPLPISFEDMRSVLFSTIIVSSGLKAFKAVSAQFSQLRQEEKV